MLLVKKLMHPLFEKASALTDEAKTSTGGSRERREHLLGFPCGLPFNLKTQKCLTLAAAVP